MRSSDILRDYYRNNLDGEDLAKWSEFLVSNGFESEDIYLLMSRPDLHWSELPEYVERICKEIGACTDFTDPYKAYMEASIVEYKKGLLSGAELLFNFDEIRKEVGFPETLTWRIMEDDDSGSNRSGIYSDATKRTGSDLENYVNEFISRTNL